MTIFARYVFRQAGGALLLILVSLSGIVWISLALRELDVVTAQGQSGWTLLKMTTLGLPNFMAIIAPFAFLIAVIHTLNRLNGDSELIVLTASGATIWTVARPILALAVLVAAFVSFVNHLAMPWSLRLLGEIVLQVRTDLLTQVMQPGRFSSPERGVTFHIRERELNGELRGLLMQDARDAKQVQSYLAEHSVIVKQGATAYMVMTDGHIVRRTDATAPAQVVAFQKYVVDLDQFEEKTTDAADLKPRERYFSELTHPEPGSHNYRQSPGRFQQELHERFSNPFYPLAFALFALAAVGQAQSTRQNRLERIFGALVGAGAIRLSGLAVSNIVVVKAAAAPVLYLIPFLAAGTAVVLMVRGARPRGGRLLLERIIDLLAPLAESERMRRARPARALATGRS